MIWAKRKSGPKPKVPLHPMPSRNYLEFVSELHDRLSTANHYMRQSLQVAQHQQKDAYDKDIRNMVFQTGDLVLRYTPQLKPGEAN